MVCQWFITQKVYFSRLIRVCVGLLMLAASPGFLASYWPSGFETFLNVSTHASHWLDLDCANFTLTPDETNTNPSRETISLKGRFLKIKLVGAHCSGWGYSAPTPSSWQKANLPSSQPFQGSTTHASKSIFFSEQNVYFIRLLLGNLRSFVNFDENSRKFVLQNVFVCLNFRETSFRHVCYRGNLLENYLNVALFWSILL